jgi:phospholipase C
MTPMKNILAVLLLSIVSFAQTSPIEHVIVIIKENHSFVNYFGTWPTDNVTTGRISTGATVTLTHGLDAPLVNCGHQWGDFHGDWNKGQMNRFDKHCGTSPNAFQAYIQYYQADIPNYWSWAQTYGLARMFFPSIDGGSFAAHLAIVGGGNTNNIVDIPNGFLGPTGFCDPATTALVRSMNPSTNRAYKISPCTEMPVMPDMLDAAGVSWSFYAPTKNAITPLIWNPLNAIKHVVNGSQYRHVYPFTQFAKDAAAGTLSQVVWLTADAIRSEHPRQSVSVGEQWTAQQVAAVASAKTGCSNGTGLWNCSVIFVYWDDPGGFYENVYNPDPSYFSLGSMRVPLLCVGPYCNGKTTSTVLTDQSINKCIENLFGAASLTTLDAGAADICADMLDVTLVPKSAPAVLLSAPILRSPAVAIDGDVADEDDDDLILYP